MQLAAAVTLIYGALTLAGGVLGYVRAKSRVSLIFGLAFGSALIFCGWVLLQGSTMVASWALGLTVLLASFFGFRFFKTRSWMPSGVMLILSLVALIFLSGLIL